MKILVITGGSSSERKISLISANQVAKALNSNGHEVTVFDFKKGYKQLDKLIKRFDKIFPVMHGKEGEDGTLYKYLQNKNIEYVGSNPKGAKIAFDKILFKRYSERKKIPTAKWKAVKNVSQINAFGLPCVLKGAHGGSSHEVVLIKSKADLSSKSAKDLLKSNSCYVEQLLTGVEVTVGVLLDKALPVIEIVPESKAWFDYKNKYSGETKELPFAPSVDKKLQKRMQVIAVRVHKDLKLGSYSRMDVIIKDNVPYVLEVNTPGGVGMTPKSLLPKAAKAIGISFKQLVEKMLTRQK